MSKRSPAKLLVRLLFIGGSVTLLTFPSCTVTTAVDDIPEGGKSSGGAGGSAGSSEGGASAGIGGAAETGGVAATGGVNGVAGETSAGADAGGIGGAGGAASGRTCSAPKAEWASAEDTSCAAYCARFFDVCAAYQASADITFADRAECEASCNLFTQDQLCCRAFHAAEAQSSFDGNCAFANGDEYAGGGAGGAPSGTPCN